MRVPFTPQVTVRIAVLGITVVLMLLASVSIVIGHQTEDYANEAQCEAAQHYLTALQHEVLPKEVVDEGFDTPELHNAMLTNYIQFLRDNEPPKVLEEWSDSFTIMYVAVMDVGYFGDDYFGQRLRIEQRAIQRTEEACPELLWPTTR